MKKNLIYLLIVLLLGGVAYYLFFGKSKGNTIQAKEQEFSVKDTASVDRIFFAAKTGTAILLEKQKDGSWLLNKKFVARKDAVDLLLETFKQVSVKSPVPTAAVQNVLKTIAVDGIKVEIYAGGDMIRSFYVGSGTNDNLGTYMLSEGSEQPYVMYIPGWEGYLTPRFFLDEQEWKSRVILDGNEQTIASVRLEYLHFPDEGFELKKDASGNWSIQNLKPMKTIKANPALFKEYLTYFSNINCEGYENNNPKKDSVMSNLPAIQVKLVRTDGKTTTLKMWPRIMPERPDDPEAEKMKMIEDPERLFFYREETKDFGVMQLFNTGRIYKKFSDFEMK